MTSRPDKRTMEHAKASGIVRDNVAGTSFIPATQVKFWLQIIYKYLSYF